MAADLVCPGCSTLVPNESLVGIIDPASWDGILAWRDERCGHRWPRFPTGDPRYRLGLNAIAGDEQGWPGR